MNARGFVVSLHVAPTGAAPIQNRDCVEAVAGRGLEGTDISPESGRILVIRAVAAT